MPIVILSDGLPCNVRQLGIYELDLACGELPDKTFWYEVGLLGGQTVKASYVLPDAPPAIPLKPLEDCQPGTSEWFEWQSWQTYQAALAHMQQWVKTYEEWVNKRLYHLLLTCIDPDDIARIQNSDDQHKIETAAICPELTMEDLERQAHTIFQGNLGRREYSDHFIQLFRGWFGSHGHSEEMGIGNNSQDRLVGKEMVLVTN